MRIEFLDPHRKNSVRPSAITTPSRSLLETGKALHRIQDFPRAWPRMSKRSRRCRLTRFPYGLVYQIRGDVILIVAVMHLRAICASS